MEIAMVSKATKSSEAMFFGGTTHLASRSGEATLLEEVEGLTSSEHLDCEGRQR